MQVAGFIGLERLVLRPGRLRLQIAQVAHPMAAQTTVEARARDIRIEKLPDHRQQVVDRHQQGFAQHHRHRLLRRCQCGLKPMRRVAAVMNAVAMPPFVDGLLSRAEPFRQHRRGRVAGPDRSPNLRRRRRLLVKMDQHGRVPPRISLRTDRAMKNAERRESI